jgi:hypothetical protein
MTTGSDQLSCLRTAIAQIEQLRRDAIETRTHRSAPKRVPLFNFIEQSFEHVFLHEPGWLVKARLFRFRAAWLTTSIMGSATHTDGGLFRLWKIAEAAVRVLAGQVSQENAEHFYLGGAAVHV